MTGLFAISGGDPAGIGPEIIAGAWRRRATDRLPCFFALGDARWFAAHLDCPVAEIFAPEEAEGAFGEALPVMHVREAGDARPGAPHPDGAHCALQAMEMAIGLARSGRVDGMVTAPVAKAALAEIGFTHPGQTEFIAERCGVGKDNAVMMLAGPTLRVVPLTVHVALAEVPGRLTADLIKLRARATVRGLQRNFGIAAPRLAMAGLNPHAGESGRMGREEIETIVPAIEQLRAEGMDIAGPLPADSMFHEAARSRFDAALCCYHDQALVPLKTLHFDEGVNLTLGLPIVRTSPDHGTAIDIAGRGLARPDSMIAAIRMARECAWHRRHHDGA